MGTSSSAQPDGDEIDVPVRFSEMLTLLERGVPVSLDDFRWLSEQYIEAVSNLAQADAALKALRPLGPAAESFAQPRIEPCAIHGKQNDCECLEPTWVRLQEVLAEIRCDRFDLLMPADEEPESGGVEPAEDEDEDELDDLEEDPDAIEEPDEDDEEDEA